MSNYNSFLLIDPTWRSGQPHGPSLALAYLGSALKKEGVFVRAFDFVKKGSEKTNSLKQFYEYEKSFLDEVGKLAQYYNFIGITCNYATFTRALKVSEVCRSANPNSTIILGGPHVSSLNYLSLSRGEEYLPQHSSIDIYCVGESEETIIDIYKAITEKTDLGNIPGIIYKNGTNYTRTAERKLIKEIDSIPSPDWSIYNLEKYPNLVPITASRGCPYHCSFCDERLIWKNKYRYRRPKDVAEELIGNLKSFGINNFRFADSTLTCYAGLEELCSLIKKNDLKIQWSCYARANELNDRILNIMHNAGCTSVLIGVESGTQEVLDSMNKRLFLEDIKDAVALAQKNNIAVEASFIVGYPGETEEDIKNTIYFAKSLKADSYDWHSFFPGLEMLAQPEKWGLKINNYLNWNVDLDIPSHLYKELFEKHPEAIMIERHASARIPDVSMSNSYGYSHTTLSFNKIYDLIQFAIKETHLSGLSTEESLEYKVLLNQK